MTSNYPRYDIDELIRLAKQWLGEDATSLEIYRFLPAVRRRQLADAKEPQ
jgi:hypothetical protein